MAAPFKEGPADKKSAVRTAPREEAMGMESAAAAVAGRDAGIDVSDWIDRQPVGAFQIRVLLLCAAVVFMDGFDAQAIGYVAPSLAKGWALKPGALGPVFGAGLAGLMIGALLLGPVADRVGRKPVIVGSTLFFGLCSLATPAAADLDTLFWIRFVTGLGLGGAMPNAIALTSEFSPQRSRATMITVMFCGFSLGSALGGVLAARLIPAFGWQVVFYLGGLLPLLLVPVLLVSLPESARLLALRREPAAAAGVVALLRRISPAAAAFDPARTRFVASHEDNAAGSGGARVGFPIAQLFRNGRAGATLLLWVMFFMNLLELYFLANWLPTVINAAGIPETLAIVTTALFQVGGIVGTLTLGRLIDRWGPYGVLTASYALGGVFTVLIGMAAASSVWLVMAATFGAGLCIVGAQISANAFAAGYYPTRIRSTGVGWALGIGRIGSIVGPVLGGFMLAAHWHVPAIFAAGALPALCAASAAFALGFARFRRASAETVAAASVAPEPPAATAEI